MEETYKRRILDDVIEKRLHNKGAILLEGAKWCGKQQPANITQPVYST